VPSPQQSPQQKTNPASLVPIMPDSGQKTFQSGSLLGDLSIVTQRKWKHATVFALTHSFVLVFNNQQIQKIIKELSSKEEFVELQAFLSIIFTDFRTLSASQQRKIIDCFKPVVFLILFANQIEFFSWAGAYKRRGNRRHCISDKRR